MFVGGMRVSVGKVVGVLDQVGSSRSMDWLRPGWVGVGSGGSGNRDPMTVSRRQRPIMDAEAIRRMRFLLILLFPYVEGEGGGEAKGGGDG